MLRATVEKYLPEFVKAIERLAAQQKEDEGGKIILLHQDAFAAGYDDDEYTLLGMAVKYAGLHAVTVQVIGENRATFK